MYILPIFRKMINLNCKKYTFQDIFHKWLSVIAEIRGKYTTSCCPKCNCKTSKRKDKKLHKHKQNLKHMWFWWNQIIELVLFKRRFLCNNCNISFYEKFDFESEHWNYTKDFEKYVVWSFGFLSGNKISELYQTSVSTIYRILERIDVKQLITRWLEIMEELDEIYLWVDEHSFSGHDMVLIITDLKTKQVLAVLDWITNKILEDWIKLIPLKTQLKIKGFNTDMNKWYANTLKDILWNPIQWVDKFHLFQEANKMVDEVRQISIWALAMNFIKIEDIPKLGKKVWKKLTKKDIENLRKNSDNKAMQKYKEKAEQRLKADSIDPKKIINSKWEIVEYDEITADYFIEKWYRKLFFWREKNLSPIAKLRINQIFQEFDHLGFLQESWTIKEDFMDAMDNLDMTEIDRIRDDCLNSEHYRIKQFWRTIKRWYLWIKWFCEHSTPTFKFTNAFTEWANNLCKVAKRQSHWFRLKDMYIRKLTAKFCYKKLEIYS